MKDKTSSELQTEVATLEAAIEEMAPGQGSKLLYWAYEGHRIWRLMRAEPKGSDAYQSYMRSYLEAVWYLDKVTKDRAIEAFQKVLSLQRVKGHLRSLEDKGSIQGAQP